MLSAIVRDAGEFFTRVTQIYCVSLSSTYLYKSVGRKKTSVLHWFFRRRAIRAATSAHEDRNKGQQQHQDATGHRQSDGHVVNDGLNHIGFDVLSGLVMFIVRHKGLQNQKGASTPHVWQPILYFSGN
tara:strand:+ start:91 stop:474 length:384 start_codon:yes stop_codon:yes gene_type:complete